MRQLNYYYYYYYYYYYCYYYLTLKLFNLLTSLLAKSVPRYYTVVMDVVTIATTVLNSNGHRKFGA